MTDQSGATTLVALRTDTGERIAIGDLPVEMLRALSDARLLRCPFCGEPLTLKAGPVRIHHFAHTTQCADFDHEPETDGHRQGKLRLYQQFRPPAAAGTLERHFPATNQRADVYIEMADGYRYVLEFQQANNSASQWLERHALYTTAGVIDIWFLGQVRLNESQTEPLRPISPYDPSPVPRREFEAAAGAFHIREMEKAILSSVNKPHLPLLYYLDPDDDFLTILLARDIHHYTLRAYRYRLPLAACALREGSLWTPLDPLLEPYRSSR